MEELADRVGLSRGYLTQASRGQRCLSPVGQGASGGGPGGSGQGRSRPASHRGPESPVGTNGSPWSQPELVRLAGGHQCLLSLPDHEWQAQSVGSRAAAPARGAVCAVDIGSGGSSGGQGDGLEERRAQRRGRQGRRRAGQRRHPRGRPGPLGRRGGVRLTRRYDSRGRVSVTHVVDERGYFVMLKQPKSGCA